MDKKIDTLASVLCALEREDEIAELLQFNDSSSWVSIKNFIHSRSIPQQKNQRGVTSLSDALKYLFVLVISIVNLVRTMTYPKGRVLFVGAGSGLQMVDGVAVDSYVPENLSKDLGVLADAHGYFLSAHTIEEFWKFKETLWTRRIVIHSYLVGIWRGAFKWLVFPALTPSEKMRRGANLISEKVSSAGISLSSGDVILLHYRFIAGYYFFKVVFSLLKVRELYVVSAYSNSEQCAAARSRNALIHEIQHGVIGSVHRGYNYCTKCRLLPTPDKVIVYDEFWKSELKRAGYFLEENILISKRLKYLIAEKEKSLKLGPYYVFTGQGLLGDKVAAFLFGVLSANPENFVVYVPHPTESQEYIDNLSRPLSSFRNFIVGRDVGVSTERLIQDSLGHISIYSSCHFDAVTLLGRTFVLDVIPGNVMDYYIETSSNTFIRVKTPEDFLRSVCDE